MTDFAAQSQPSTAGFWSYENSVPTDHQFALIGRAIASWSILEQQVDVVLGRLIGAGGMPMRALTERLTANGKEQALFDLVDLHRWRYRHLAVPDVTFSALKNVARRYKKLRPARNGIAHLIWMRITDDLLFCTGLTATPPVQDRTPRDDGKPHRMKWPDGMNVPNGRLEKFISDAGRLVVDFQHVAGLIPLDSDFHRWERTR